MKKLILFLIIALNVVICSAQNFSINPTNPIIDTTIVSNYDSIMQIMLSYPSMNQNTKDNYITHNYYIYDNYGYNSWNNFDNWYDYNNFYNGWNNWNYSYFDGFYYNKSYSQWNYFYNYGYYPYGYYPYGYGYYPYNNGYSSYTSKNSKNVRYPTINRYVRTREPSTRTNSRTITENTGRTINSSNRVNQQFNRN